MLKGLSPEQREREEKERLLRQRSLLRIGVELWLVGVIRTVQDAEDESMRGGNPKAALPAAIKKDSGDMEPFPLEVLKELLVKDREHINLPLVVMFVKQFAYDVLGLKPRNTRKAVEEDIATAAAASEETSGKAKEDSSSEKNDVDPNDPPLVQPELQTRFRNVMNRYFETVKNHIVRDHERLQSQSSRNAEAYIKSGEIFEDRQANYEKLVKLQEKLVANAQTVADILGVEMPDLPDERNDDGAKDSIIREGSSMFASRGEDGKSGVWEDEDQRRFYEDLIDLKIRVPAILLEDGKKKKKDGDGKVEEETKPAEDEEKKEDKAQEGQETEEEKKAAEEAASTVIVNKTIGAQVDALLLRLPDLNNRDMIDQAAIDFCFLNSKASRNRLIRVLQEVPRSRQDLLPAYSRLTATLNRYLPDIGKALVEHLDKEFRSLQRRKEKDLSESRGRNARYLSELTKFGVVPEHVIFHCLKVALEDFHRVNIEIICHILENCGRFLLRSPETGPRMVAFLETLKKKKDGVHHLGQQERITIENAFYYVNPPERPAIAQKERSIMELFVRKMIYLDLTKRNYVKILKQLRKLHWEDPGIVGILKKVFTKVWKVRYNNIHILAIIVGALSRYHQDFAYGVIDELLEQITVGLEDNNFKHNQRRVAQIKYLGELYNYKMVDSPVIFDALYRIVTFGHDGGMPKPGVYCQLDPPDDFFRIRLVCSLLDVCGGCFDRGSSKKKLDFFLAFLQYYYYTKEPAPMDIDFLLQDTLAVLRPTWKLHSNLEEAGKAFGETVAKSYKTAENTPAEPEEADEESESDDGEGDGEGDELRYEEVDGEGDGDAEGALSDGEEGSVVSGPHSDHSDDSSDDEEEPIVVTSREQHLDPEEEAEFDREFAKMMSESLESRKFDRKPVFDVPLPIRRGTGVLTRETGVLTRENTVDSEQGEAEPEEKGTMMFSLLTKRGNRQQTKMVALPSDSGFAVAMKDKREKEREEKQKIKALVMSYDRMEEPSEADCRLPSPALFAPELTTPPALDKHAAINGYAVKIDNRSSRHAKTRKLSMSDVNWYEGNSPPQHHHRPLSDVNKARSVGRGSAQPPPSMRGRGRGRGRAGRGEFGRNSKAYKRRPAALNAPHGPGASFVGSGGDDVSFQSLYEC